MKPNALDYTQIACLDEILKKIRWLNDDKKERSNKNVNVNKKACV